MPPIISVVGASNTGKTRLIEQVLPRLGERGLRIGTLKHASHGFDLDASGTDSDRHAQAGSSRVVLVGPEQRVVLEPDAPDAAAGGPSLATLTQRHFRDCDAVIAEGFTWEPGPKVLVHRRGQPSKPLPSPDDLVLVVSDEPLGHDNEVHPDDLDALVDRIHSIITDLIAEAPSAGVTLLVDGLPIPLTEFVSSFLAGAVRGMVGELKGIDGAPDTIELYIQRV